MSYDFEKEINTTSTDGKRSPGISLEKHNDSKAIFFRSLVKILSILKNCKMDFKKGLL